MCANIYVFIYFMISYGKYIAILYHYLTFSVNTRVQSPSVAGAAPVEAQKRKGVAGAAPSAVRQPRVISGTCDGPSLP